MRAPASMVDVDSLRSSGVVESSSLRRLVVIACSTVANGLYLLASPVDAALAGCVGASSMSTSCSVLPF